MASFHKTFLLLKSRKTRHHPALLCTWKSCPCTFLSFLACCFSLPSFCRGPLMLVAEAPVLQADTHSIWPAFFPKISIFSEIWTEHNSHLLLQPSYPFPCQLSARHLSRVNSNLVMVHAQCPAYTEKKKYLCLYYFKGNVWNIRNALILWVQYKWKIINSISCYGFLLKSA